MRLISKQFLYIYILFDKSVIGRKKMKKIYDKINTALYAMLIIIILLLISGIIYVNKLNKEKEITTKNYNEMKVEFDSLKKNNTYLISQMDEIKNKFKVLNLDKYPFDIKSSTISELKSYTYDLLMDIGASRMSISLFHNNAEDGYEPIKFDNIMTYKFASVLVSSSNGHWKPYDEFIYQNITLKIFATWFKKTLANKKDYIYFEKETASDEDVLLFKMVLLDYDKVQSAFIFGIPNKGNVQKYGPFIGTIIFDCDNKSNIDASDISKVRTFASRLGEYMNNIRRE